MWLWRAMASMWRSSESAGQDAERASLVVGLGNPGLRYANTRHNVGFQVVDHLARAQGDDRFRSRFGGRISRLHLECGPLILLKPETYMNLSGKSVRAAAAYYRIRHEQILVICDDLNLPIGKLRVRARGSDGGHRGLRSLAEELGTTNYPRLRIGIGSAASEGRAVDYVLSRFTPEESELITAAVTRASQLVLLWCSEGIEQCMNQFN